MKAHRYAIFDMDGTLLESMQYWRTIVLDLLEHYGIKIEESLKKEVVYYNFSRAVAFLKEHAPHPLLDKLKPEMAMHIMDGHYERDVTVRRGVTALLDRLKGDGVRMCILTATPTESTRRALARHGLLDYFEFILSPVEVPGGKKNPEAFYEACRRFGGAEPSECALYEDAFYSMKTAKPLGLYIVATEDALAAKEKDAIFAICDEYYTDGFLTRLK
jgi:HAD superfamily hydrolase (TIGR01509 family)